MLPEDPGPFPYGIASFEPSSSGITLWTRTSTSEPLRWQLASDAEFVEIVAEGSTDVLSSEGSGETIHLAVVDGLEPATDHYYRFTGDNPSPVGRTHTLPDDDRPIRLAFACCGDFSAGHFGVYRAIAEADVDLVVHLGDYVYADPEGDDRAVELGHDAVTRSDYRCRYQEVRSDPDLQALHQRHPMVAVIDDHDLTDNAHEEGAKNHDPAVHGPWAQRRDAAAAERRDWLPIPPEGPDGRGRRGEWRALDLGTLGQLVLLDTRLAGRTPPADDDDAPSLDAPDRTMLGRAQMDWAVERLADRRRPWCLLVSSVVFNPLRIELPAEVDIQDALPPGYLVADGVGVNTDAWDGYPGDRSRLVAAAQRRGSGTVVVSGDVHSSWAWEGPSAEDGTPVAVEMTCPAVTSVPMGEAIPVLVGRALDAMIDRKDGVRWAEIFGRGHLVVEVAPTEVTGTWYFSDTEAPDPSPEVEAQWRTRLDRPGRLEPVDADTLPVASGDPRRAATPVPGRPTAVHEAARRRDARRRLAVTALVTAAILVAQDAWNRARRQRG